tara:strand:+ start:16 stop:1464 length:1449 start_codon:yes stop_codon:yes gene_type:complete
MKELDQLVENFLQPKKKGLSMNQLIELIEEVIETTEPLAEEEQTGKEVTPDINIKLPAIRITEDFGRIGTKDREIIETYTKNIQGSTLQEKIANLNSVLTEKKADADIGEILATMMVCEILYSIISQFTESAGGFIFEGFLAGLFGGKAVQITDPSEIEGMDASGKPITDVILGDRHYSLKLLGQKTEVKGSFRNMVEHFKVIDHIVYLDARRVDKDQGLQLGEFTITLEDFLDVFFDPIIKKVGRTQKEFTNAKEFKTFLKSLKGKATPKGVAFGKPGFVKDEKFKNTRQFIFTPRLDEAGVSSEGLKQILRDIQATPDEELDQYAPFVALYADSKYEGSKAEKLFGQFSNIQNIQKAINSRNKDQIIAALEKTPGYQDQLQFNFTRLQSENIENFKEIGTLMIGEKYMKAAFAAYGDKLLQTIVPVYNSLQAFTDNVNQFFLGVSEGEQDRKQYGLDAIKDAQTLESATDKAVKDISKTT